MRWSVVARQYSETFEQAIAEHGRNLGSLSQPDATLSQSVDLPEIKLSHLRALTDSTGLLQHADYDVPCYSEGYCLDDNARAATHDTARRLRCGARSGSAATFRSIPGICQLLVRERDAPFSQ